jgi:predicted alpha/beta-fold hydrolase
VLCEVALVARNNPFITAEFHSSGGHVGFVSGKLPRNERYYGEERAIEFLGQQIDAIHVKAATSVHHSSR